MENHIARWTPFGHFEQAFAPVLQALGQGPEGRNEPSWRPLTDVHEADDGYRIDLELPAMDPKDVRVELRDGLLRISGERRFENGERDGRAVLRERGHGKFLRAFRLPDDADADDIRATGRNGVVSVFVAKRVSAQPRAIAVEAA